MNNQLSRHERISLRKKEIGTKLDRKLKRYSDNFNEIFNFFLISYRKKILSFCGSNVEVIFDNNEVEAKNAFRRFDNGQYKNDSGIATRHPNILKGVIIGKKSWGLHVNMWAEGIAEGCFTKQEIIQEFVNNKITIPESLFKDFENRIYQKMSKRHEYV